MYFLCYNSKILVLSKPNVEYKIIRQYDNKVIDTLKEFYQAYAKGYINVVKYLFMQDLKSTYIDVVPVEWYSDYEYLNIIKYILTGQSRNINPLYDNRLNIIKYLLSQGGYVKEIEYYLVDACKLGHINTVKYLINEGAKILNLCLRSASHNGHINVVKYLIKQGVDVNEIFDLEISYEQGHLLTFNYLLSFMPITPYIINKFKLKNKSIHKKVVLRLAIKDMMKFM